MLLVNKTTLKFLLLSLVYFKSIFSEENIWKLCECWKQNDPNHLKYLYAVFISNERRQIPIWEQKSASNDEHLVIWVKDFV
jgi:hypothetical protein